MEQSTSSVVNTGINGKVSQIGMSGEQLTQDVDYTPTEGEDFADTDSHFSWDEPNSLRTELNEIKKLLLDRLPTESNSDNWFISYSQF